MHTLNAKYKTDRLLMIQELQSLALELGVDTEVQHEGSFEREPELARLTIRCPQGLYATIDIDGENPRPNIFVVPWNISILEDTRLADEFGDINNFHFQKATSTALTFFQLKADLTKRIKMALDGSAFSEVRKARQISIYGTAAARHAKLMEHRRILSNG